MAKKQTSNTVKKQEYKVKKGASGVAYSTDAEEGFKVIDIETANQEQLEFLFKRKHPSVEKK